jgi:hypothetical protein
VDKLSDKLIELLTGGFFFEHPGLIPFAILVGSVIIAGLYYRWRYSPASELGPWRSVLSVWVITVVGLSLVGWLIYRCWGLPHPFATGQIGILVAEVPDQDNREQQTAYQTAILRQVHKNEQLREVVKIRLIERPLPPDADAQQAEALKIGRRLRASFVLRPFIVEGAQQPWITMVDPQEIFRPLVSLGEFPSAQLATPDKLPLPENIVELAEIIFALALIERHSNEEAA